MITIVIAMIAVSLMGMMHAHVVAAHEAFAIFMARFLRYGWMPEHTRISRIHPTVVIKVEACCLDAIMEALPPDVTELRRRGIPLSGIALRGVVIPLLRTILLGMETDARECSQGKCKKWCGETNGSHKDSSLGKTHPMHRTPFRPLKSSTGHKINSLRSEIWLHGRAGFLYARRWMQGVVQAAVDSALRRSAVSCAMSASIVGCSWPSITIASWWLVRPMRWSVRRFCGKL